MTGASTAKQMIKSVDPDYVTAYFGKWGFHPRPPEHAEYDQSDGNTNNGEGDHLSVKQQTPLPPNDPKRIFSITRRAHTFMEEQVKAGKPFFMELSHYAVHVGHGALAETIEAYRKLPTPKDKKYHGENALVYAAMIENLDTGLAMLCEKIEQLGIKDNTYLLFTSDNGGGFKDNGPLKGGKGSTWEGGIRVPTVVCGPGVLKGSYCDVPVAGWDFFYPWYGNMPPMSTIRDGDYKLVMSLNNGEYRLYNLADDIGEANDLKGKMPDKAKKLHRRLLKYLKDVDAEDVEDMRQARKKEVQGYRKRELLQENPSEERLRSFERSLQMFEDNRKLGLDGSSIMLGVK